MRHAAPATAGHALDAQLPKAAGNPLGRALLAVGGRLQQRAGKLGMGACHLPVLGSQPLSGGTVGVPLRPRLIRQHVCGGGATWGVRRLRNQACSNDSSSMRKGAVRKRRSGGGGGGGGEASLQVPPAHRCRRPTFIRLEPGSHVAAVPLHKGGVATGSKAKRAPLAL